MVRNVESVRYPFEAYIQQSALSIIRKHNSFPHAIREILETEVPLSEEYLLKRIVNLFGREKVTKVVIENYEVLMRNCIQCGIVRKNGYLYLNDTNANRLIVPNCDSVLYNLRVPGDLRDVKYIAPQELAGGMYYIIQQNITVTKDGLYKLLTNLLGFSRTGEAIVEKYDIALGILSRAKLIRKNRDLISLIK